uniref:Uncharacterized protein n=1 Tax=Setaria italica TaxID=4555 RepID=K3ZK90_SETIT
MLHEEKDEDTRTVTDALKSTPGVAELLLRHCKWLPQVVLFEWCNNEEALRDVADLPRNGRPVENITMMKALAQQAGEVFLASNCCYAHYLVGSSDCKSAHQVGKFRSSRCPFLPCYQAAASPFYFGSQGVLQLPT